MLMQQARRNHILSYEGHELNHEKVKVKRISEEEKKESEAISKAIKLLEVHVRCYVPPFLDNFTSPEMLKSDHCSVSGEQTKRLCRHCQGSGAQD